MIAKNSNEFTEKVSSGIIKALNTDNGRLISDTLLKKSMEKNPEMTPEEWEKIKGDFLVFIFYELLKRNKNLMDEFAGHMYTELKGVSNG